MRGGWSFGSQVQGDRHLYHEQSKVSTFLPASQICIIFSSQCCRSLLISKRIRTQHFRSIRIRILDPGFHNHNEVKKNFDTFRTLFSSQIAIQTLSKDSQAQLKIIRLSLKGQCFFSLKSLNFSLLGRQFDCPGDPGEPYQYAST